ncbi:MAG: cytochrome b/b6 domain-containing protein [Myxococcota bacterium]
MKRILVWDVPIRLFHWLLAGSFVAAFLIANTTDDDGAAFGVHMILGLIMAFMVALRLVWGLVGSRWSRFGSFSLGPAALARYLREALTGGGERHAGHNPASALAAVLIFGFVLGLAGTGLLMSSGSEAAEEVHEVLAWALLVVVGAHVAGVAWHSIRHRENLPMSMVDGRKEAEPSAAIPSSRAVVGLVFLALTGLWAGGLFRSWDPATSQLTVPVVGSTLYLGEGEEHEEHEGYGEYEEHEDDD